MATEKARIEKEKGNSAFKTGDYATAIGHYSAAIIHDRKDYTLPLNRAAAYLKLGKHEDASRDCTTVLSLNPSNVKALFRRGQALVELQRFQDAQSDFEAAAKIEPNNQLVKDELEKLRKISAQKPVKGKPAPPKKLETPSFMRRRVPITIIEPESTHASNVKTSETTTTSDTAPQAQTSAEPPSTSPSSSSTPKTFQEAKRTRDETKQPFRVGGGIFRASGKNTIFPTRDESEVTNNEPVPAPPPSIRPAPVKVTAKSYESLFELAKTWSALSSVVERFQLISKIPPSEYPAFFKTSLEPSLLLSIARTYLEFLTSQPNAVAQVKRSMEGFLQVPRINTIALFFSRDEKGMFVKLLEKIDDQGLTDRWKVLLKL